jgi:hypothetical protein
MVDEKSRRDWWKHISGILVALQTAALLVSVYLLHQQITDIENAKFTREADFVLKFDERLGRDPYAKIRSAIKNNKPILKAHGGKFNDDELGDYLGVYETLEAVYSRGLISKEMLYAMYGIDLSQTFKNSEVQEYLKVVRKEEPNLYTGGESLAEPAKTQATLSPTP